MRGVAHHIVEPRKVPRLAGREEVGHAGRDFGGHGRRRLRAEPVAVAAIAIGDDGIAVLLERAEEAADGGRGGTGRRGGVGKVEGQPLPSRRGEIEQGGEQFAFVRSVGGQQAMRRCQEFEAARAPVGTQGMDEALEFQIGKDGLEHVRPDVGGRREVVVRDLEGLALTQQGIDDGADGARSRGVAADEIAQHCQVVPAGQQQAMRGHAVAAGPAGFLEIVLQRLRQVEMDDAADVAFVDAHAEGDGRGHDLRGAVHEGVLGFGPLVRRQAGMIGPGTEALVEEGRGHALRLFLQRHVDHRWQPAGAPQRRHELRQALRGGHRLHMIGKIRAAERGLNAVPGLDAEGPADVVGGGRRGRGCQAEHGREVQLPCHAGEAQVVRAEIVTPFRNAVGLVHGEQGDAQPPETLHEGVVREALRRHVEQPQPPGEGILPQGGLFRGGQGGIEARRADALGPQGFHLVLHQGEQRRHDQRRALAEQRRNLIAERLPGTGREKGERGAAGQQRRHHRLLPGTEGGVAEVPAERVERGHAAGMLASARPVARWRAGSIGEACNDSSSRYCC